MTLQRVIEMTNPVDQVAVDIAALFHKATSESEGIKPTSFTSLLEEDNDDTLIYKMLVKHLLDKEYDNCPVELAMNFESGLSVIELIGFLRTIDSPLAETVKLECLAYDNNVLNVLMSL